MAENQVPHSKLDAKVYDFNDVTAMSHIASVHGKTRTITHELGVCGSLTGQAVGFDPAHREDYLRVAEYLNNAQKEIDKATEIMAAIQSEVMGRPHVVAEIQRELDSGPWRGVVESTTYPNGVPVDPMDLVGRDLRISTSETTTFKKASPGKLAGEPPANT